MGDLGDSSVISSGAGITKAHKSHELATLTIKAPQFSYVKLSLVRDSVCSEPVTIDAIQVRSYCTSALKQFLGVSGAAISLDILKIEAGDCWLRVPRDNIGAFSAAITAWQGTYENGERSALRVKGCSDWLGILVGRGGEERLWSG
ncbi:hypothetical protein BX600DRAFT_516463 [Xylariales sp. PMI_506]|nr:hypothetical protein BX600DRAFT_516463 [Xylariales sp. PMI_506]